MATLLFLLLISFIIAFWMIYLRRRAAHTQEKQQLKSAYDQELLRAQLEIKEQTQKNISQEIHDNIGQVLSLVKLNMGTMSLANAPELDEKLQDSKQLLSKAIHDLRNLSKSLDTDMISEKGLCAGIAQELEMVRKTGAYEVNYKIDGMPVRMEANKELILFRIFQEVLNNIIKHAHATTIDVNANFYQDNCLLEILDNGDGIPPSMLQGESFGLGLRSMRKRSSLIGADLQFSSNVPKGTAITIKIPYLTVIENHQ
ncbi:sensor histidine kinase [Chitinophaga sp. Hz27]|uniref:sensor histidine kinase n=1 Tax=Chitinophaga sp. Hz27 TaxID=3347169 RepID=UPI0035DF2FAD